MLLFGDPVQRSPVIMPEYREFAAPPPQRDLGIHGLEGPDTLWMQLGIFFNILFLSGDNLHQW